ncbi:hypothetical protein Hanom_Chr06g00511301 [Helianthus anomalus]
MSLLLNLIIRNNQIINTHQIFIISNLLDSPPRSSTVSRRTHIGKPVLAASARPVWINLFQHIKSGFRFLSSRGRRQKKEITYRKRVLGLWRESVVG